MENEHGLNAKLNKLEMTYLAIYEYEDLQDLIIEGVPASELDPRAILAMLYMCNQAERNNMLISVKES